MKEPPQQVSESVRRLNPHLYSAPPTHSTAPRNDSMVVGETKTPKRIRQSQKPLLNALEREWLAFYEKWFTNIHSQGIRFKLGNGIWYKPDFVCFSVKTCWEIKGKHAFRGGFENLKVAAHQYPEFKWVLAWKEGGAWKEQTVLP